MGNRGTTPSWDEEEIAKYGLLMHWGFISSMDWARHERWENRKKLLVELVCLLDERLKQEQDNS